MISSRPANDLAVDQVSEQMQGVLEQLISQPEAKELQELVRQNIVSVFDYGIEGLDTDQLAGGYFGSLIEDRLPQRHLGPAAAAMERKGTVTEMGEKNREILSINRMLGSLKRAAKKLGDKIAELMAAIHQQPVAESPALEKKRDQERE